VALLLPTAAKPEQFDKRNCSQRLNSGTENPGSKEMVSSVSFLIYYILLYLMTLAPISLEQDEQPKFKQQTTHLLIIRHAQTIRRL